MVQGFNGINQSGLVQSTLGKIGHYTVNLLILSFRRNKATPNLGPSFGGALFVFYLFTYCFYCIKQLLLFFLNFRLMIFLLDFNFRNKTLFISTPLGISTPDSGNFLHIKRECRPGTGF